MRGQSLESITTTTAAGRQETEFYSYIGRLRQGPNPLKNNFHMKTKVLYRFVAKFEKKLLKKLI